MPDVRHFNVATDWPDDEKIKMIETLPEGDTILVIWFKLLAWAARINDEDGLIGMPYETELTDETIATIVGRSLNLTRLAMTMFVRFHMIERNETCMRVINWGKHQYLDGLARIREKARQRQARFRERQRQFLQLPSPQDGNATITSRNAPKSKAKGNININSCSSDDLKIFLKEQGCPMNWIDRIVQKTMATQGVRDRRKYTLGIFHDWQAKGGPEIKHDMSAPPTSANQPHEITRYDTDPTDFVDISGYRERLKRQREPLEPGSEKQEIARRRQAIKSRKGNK